jgi:hypothetical protein
MSIVRKLCRRDRHPAAPRSLSHPRLEMHPKQPLKTLSALKMTEGPTVHPDYAPDNQTEKSMVSISFFDWPYRSLKRSDTVT